MVSVTVFNGTTVGGKKSNETTPVNNMNVMENVVNEASDTTFTVDNVDVLELAIFDDTTINVDSDLESENSDSTSISDTSINLYHITDFPLLILAGRRPIVISGACNLNNNMYNLLD